MNQSLLILHPCSLIPYNRVSRLCRRAAEAGCPRLMAEQTTDALEVTTAKLTVVDKLRMLLDITKKISRSLDVDEVLELVMDTLGSLIPYDAAGIYMIERNSQADGGDDGDLGALKGFS